MSRPGLTGLALLAVVAAGCGGALSGGTGGTGGGSGGVMTGGGGTTGSGGQAGRSPYEGSYIWGNSFVSVGPDEPAFNSFTFAYTAQEEIEFKAMVTLPSATDDPPTNGARLSVRYGCSAAPYTLDMNSCPTPAGGGTPPGCITFSLNNEGTMTGDYVDAAGALCVVESGDATVYLPLPEFTLPAGTRGNATGSFRFFCIRPDGARWYVAGRFAVPAQSSALLCFD